MYHTADLKATLDAYTKGLGLEKGFTFERDGAPFGYYLSFANTSFTEIFKGAAAEEGRIKHFAVQVDNLDLFINS
ncbi:hypothetical protein BVX99_03205 [bacterium F16]|nr:hypothetical protein BVX99_03205 [bacterium F16]